MAEANRTLDQARCDARLSHKELWLRYFALGGMRSTFEIEAILYEALTPTARDYDLIAVALNERFYELGANYPIAYADDDAPEKKN
jgi:hypothetical protein